MATHDECERAITLYESALLEFKNVESVAIVADEPRDVARDATNLGASAASFVVAIIVSRKVPYDELDEDDLLPSYLQIIDALKGVIKVKTRVFARGDWSR